MNPLVSIVIPTYNRYPYLIECLTLLLSFESADFEVVVQDNSEDTGPVEAFLRDCNDSRLRYFHDARFHYSQTENSELAVEKAVGDYVCYIGDDDALSREVVSAASWMKRMDVDALLFDGAPYYWPDVVFERNPKPCFSIREFDASVERIDALFEYRLCARRGAVDIGGMPRLYHGMVSRDALLEAKSLAGSFFPGASPDMASSVVLSHTVKNPMKLHMPLLIDGFSYRSAGGKSLRGKHKARIEDVDQLPDDIAEVWNRFVPRIWLGETIYAQSFYEASSRIGLADEIDYRKLYSSVIARNPDCWKYVLACPKRCAAALIAFDSTKAFSKRVAGYIARSLMPKDHSFVFASKEAMPIRQAEAELTCKIAPLMERLMRETSR